jgi:hypothetical protein
MNDESSSFRRRTTRHLKVATLLTLLASLLLSVTTATSSPPAASARAVPARATGIRCTDDAVRSCKFMGRNGTQTCIRGDWGPCVTDVNPSSVVNGSVRLKYLILTVVYAPPGTTGGHSTSSVTYGSGSSMGTKMTASNSFKQGVGVTAEVEGGEAGSFADTKFTFGFAQTKNEGDAIEIKKNSSSEINVNGPASDGIDHDHDMIYLWLSPVIDLALTPTAVSWNFATDANIPAGIIFVYVGWLKDPSQQNFKGVAQTLAEHGITPADYPDILRADPFANGSTTIDPQRYRIVNTTFPYEPPFKSDDPPPGMKFVTWNSTGLEKDSSVKNEYDVGVSVEVGAKLGDALKASLKVDGKWNWTSEDTTASSSGTSETASVMVGSPSAQYTSSDILIGVYYDVLYKTFMFAPFKPPPNGLHGDVLDRGGNPQAFREVVLIAHGVKYRTFTNARGEYRFGQISGPIRLRSGRTVRRLRRVPSTREVPIVVH